MSIVDKFPQERKSPDLNSFYVFKEQDLTLNIDDPQIPYSRNIHTVSPSWGQYKLFLSVIELLNYKYSKAEYPNLHFVYVGAAPGTNINLLKRMYPDIKWILYDPRPIEVSGENVTIYQQFFDDNDAAQWATYSRQNNIPVAFYSDIRSVDYKEHSQTETELFVERDMQAQSRWYEIIQPVFAMFKFRLRYSGKGVESNVQYYNNGTIFKGIYSAPSSSETRLVPYGYNKIPYDIIKYENQMAFHNRITRKLKFLIPNLDIYSGQYPYNEEFINSYDSVAGVIVLLQYLQKRSGLQTATLENAYNIHKLFVKTIGQNRPEAEWVTIERLVKEPLMIKRKFLKKQISSTSYDLTEIQSADFSNLWYQYKVSKLLLEKLQELTKSGESADKKNKKYLMAILEKWLLEIMDCPECVSADNWENYYNYFQATADIEKSLFRILQTDIRKISEKELNIGVVLKQLAAIISGVGPTKFNKKITIIVINQKYDFYKNALTADSKDKLILVGIYSDLIQILDGESVLNIYRNPIIDRVYQQDPLGTLFSLIKYHGMMYGINQLSLTDDVWVKIKKLGFINDAFSSPFNSRLVCVPEDMRFCRYLDKSAPEATYVGDFFQINLSAFNGYWVVFPPTVEKIVMKTINHISQNLQFLQNVLLIIPVYENNPGIEVMKKKFQYVTILKDSIDVLLFDGRKIKNPIDLQVFLISNVPDSPLIRNVVDIIQNIYVDSRVAQKENIAIVAEFPYKRTYTDKEKVWKELLTTDISSFEELSLNQTWPFIPEKYNFFITEDGRKVKLALINAANEYEQNIISDLFAEEARMQACIRGQIDPYSFYQANYPEILKDAKIRMEEEKQRKLQSLLESSNSSQNPSSSIISRMQTELQRIENEKRQILVAFSGDQQREALNRLELERNRIIQESGVNLDDKGLNYYLRESLYAKAKHLECSTFKATVAKAINKFFDVKVLLDPSAGWTDRIAGAAAAGVETYHGIDPNPALVQPYHNIVNFFREQKEKGNMPESVNLDNYVVIDQDFTAIEGFPEGYYDMVFTSPPFYDYEIYNQDLTDPKQSIFQKKDVNSWLKEFLFPYLEKAWLALRSGGRLALYISDPGPEKYIEKMINYINFTLAGNYKGVIAVMNSDRKRANPLWVWQKP